MGLWGSFEPPRRPPPPPAFRHPMKMKSFDETKVFHYHGIFKKKNEIKSAKGTPAHLYLSITSDISCIVAC